jgi:hypothetical protein
LAKDLLQPSKLKLQNNELLQHRQLPVIFKTIDTTVFVKAGNKTDWNIECFQEKTSQKPACNACEHTHRTCDGSGTAYCDRYYRTIEYRWTAVNRTDGVIVVGIY